MKPDSAALLAILLLGCGGLITLVIRLRPLAIRIGCAALTVALAMLSGMAVVNDYFGYYTSWTAVASDLSGSYTSFAAPAAGSQARQPALHGRLERMTFAGARSGITRSGLVYLPPQYFQPRYRHVRFPVVELLHGTPGFPAQYIVQLRLVQVVDSLLTQHRMGPLVIAMPTDYSGHHFQEGVDSMAGLDDTYLTRDVPAELMARLRVTRDRAMWGIGGFSSGGYIAANLALRHRTAFGASAIMDGYFRPQDGEAAGIIGNDPAALGANDPLLAAQGLPAGAGPLPAFWVSAGSGNAADFHAAQAFVASLRRVEQVPLEIEANAHHTFYAWAAALPHALTWLWQQLAAPALRVQFPVTGLSPTATLRHVPHAPHRAHRAQPRRDPELGKRAAAAS